MTNLLLQQQKHIQIVTIQFTIWINQYTHNAHNSNCVVSKHWTISNKVNRCQSTLRLSFFTRILWCCLHRECNIEIHSNMIHFWCFIDTCNIFEFLQGISFDFRVEYSLNYLIFGCIRLCTRKNYFFIFYLLTIFKMFWN